MFLVKWQAKHNRKAALLKSWYIIDFFLDIFLKQVVFGTNSEKNLWWSLFIVELHSVHHRLATSKLSQSVIYCSVFIFVEELNCLKDYMKARSKASGRDDTTPHTSFAMSVPWNEITIITTLRQVYVRFNWKLFYENKTTPSSPSYFWVCVFEGIPVTLYTSIIPSMFKEFRPVVCLENT